MTVLLMNIPLVVLFVALWAGIPAWLVLRHPDQRPEPAAAAPAVAALPASRHDDAGYRRAA
jgi:hypothetical protein